jgi:uncharacterized CHY-type Zn-finger protein
MNKLSYGKQGCGLMPKSKNKQKNSEKIVKCPLCRKIMDYQKENDNWKCKDCQVIYDYAYETS